MRGFLTLDIECGPNYFIVGLYDPSTEEVWHYQSTETGILDKLKNYTIITFNGNNYDMPMLALFLQGKAKNELFEASNKLVNDEARPWDYMSDGELDWIDHIDIREPAPGVMVSLKLYGARLHSKMLQDLPYAHDEPLSATQLRELERYNLNDLTTTWELYKAIEPRIKLREQLSERYGIDLRSKSDAQIAEAIIIEELGITKRGAQRPPRSIVYKAPSSIKFKDKQLKALYDDYTKRPIKINPANGAPIMPEWLKDRVIEINGTKYKPGLGGLHSMEKSQVITGGLHNADVASYYPSMIIHYGFVPSQLGRPFLKLYKSIYKERVKAKRTGDEVTNQGFKIVLNGSFGKLGSKFSVLYAPDLLLQVTITGQLLLLMLIERLERKGIHVVSANTDGIEYVGDRKVAHKVIAKWEKRSGMTMEHGDYRMLASRDVNNYVAVYDGYTKAKGVYAPPELRMNSEYPIVFEAIREFLLNGTPLDEVINKTDDIRQFLTMRTVNGGAVWGGEFLGRVVRWVYVNGGEPIYYKKSGNKVPKTDNARPIMTLPDDYSVPADLDREAYIKLAIKHLQELGVNYYDARRPTVSTKKGLFDETNDS